MKNGKNLKNIFKIVLVVILIFPCVILFNGCSCSTDNGSSGNQNTNVTYTVMFYTGNPDKFNIPKQEVKQGGLVTKPNTTGWYYYDEATGKNYSFGDWYSDPSLKLRYVWKFATDEVYSNLTLYAKWNEIPTT